jgi:hypothetical protein
MRRIDQLCGDAAEQTPAGGYDFQQHAEAKIDHVFPAPHRRHRARRRDHRRETDRGGDGKRKVQPEIEERHEKDAAGQAEQRSHRASDDTRDEDDQRKRRRNDRHPLIIFSQVTTLLQRRRKRRGSCAFEI